MNIAKKFDVDVLVCGGGVAGAAAGVAAARLGARTLLVEGRESLGGLCTNGYISGIAGVVEGLCEEWVDRLAAKGAALKRPHLPVIEPEMGKMELEQMLLQAGCRILYGVHVADCIVEDGKITSVVAYSKSGRMEISAKIFIDCTGDADLAFAAGVPCEVGNAEYCGLNQSVTMGIRLSYVNVKKYQEADVAFQKTGTLETRMQLVVAKEHEAIANGDLPWLVVPGLLVYPVPGGDPECCDVTLDATQTDFCRNNDVEDLTRQIVDQHRQVQWFAAFLKKYVPGFEKSAISAVASMNGVRDSRRIVGEYIFSDAEWPAPPSLTMESRVTPSSSTVTTQPAATTSRSGTSTCARRSRALSPARPRTTTTSACIRSSRRAATRPAPTRGTGRGALSKPRGQQGEQSPSRRSQRIRRVPRTGHHPDHRLLDGHGPSGRHRRGDVRQGRCGAARP